MEPVFLGIAATCAFVGLVGLPLWMRKVPMNHFYGFRTPRTVTDERVWYPVNAVIGRDLTLAGFGSAAGSLAVGALGVPAGIDPYVAVTVLACGLTTLGVLHAFWFASGFVADLDTGAIESTTEDTHEAAAQPRRAPQSESER